MMPESKEAEGMVSSREAAVNLLFEALGFNGRVSVFAKVPLELKEKILRYLTRRDLQILSGVSRGVREAVVPYLWNPEEDPYLQVAKRIGNTSQVHKLRALREVLPGAPDTGVFRVHFTSRAERVEAAGLLAATQVSTLTPAEVEVLRSLLDRMIRRVDRTETSAHLWLCASRCAFFVGMPMLMAGLMGDLGSAGTIVASVGGGVLGAGALCFCGASYQASRVAEAGVTVDLAIVPPGTGNDYVALP